MRAADRTLKLSRWTAERAFLTLSLVFGTFFVVATPPFQSPDEVNHFLRIYQISEGRIVGDQQGATSGGDVPTNLWIEAHHFDRLQFDPQARTSAREILNHLLYGPRFGIDTDGPRQFGAFPNTVRYSPAPYVPHVVALLVARAARLTVLAGAYACRLAALAVAILLIRASLRLLPEALKWSFAALALLPMGLFMTSMASPDAVMIGTALGTFGLAVWLRHYPTRPASRAIRVGAGASIVVISLSKAGYFLVPAALAIALFPRQTSWWRRAMLLSGTVVVAFALSAAWLALIADVRTAPREDPAIDPDAQLARVIDDPMVFVDALQFDVSRRWRRYYDSFIGNLGWLDLPLPRWTLTALTLLFVLFAVTRGRSEAGSPFTFGEAPARGNPDSHVSDHRVPAVSRLGDGRRRRPARRPAGTPLLSRRPRPANDRAETAAPGHVARYRPAVFVLGYGVCLTATAVTAWQRYYG